MVSDAVLKLVKLIRRTMDLAKDRGWVRARSSAMPTHFHRIAIAFFLLVACQCLGCSRSNPYLTATPSGFSGTVAAPNIASPQFTAQITELERRAKLLDDNNRQLTTQLAQSQQQMQLFKERSELMQRQLQDVGNQLAQARMANSQSSQQLRGLADQVQSVQSSQQKRGGARLTANTSNRMGSEPLRDLGYAVEDDGGVVRLRVPSDQLFQPGTAQLSPSASSILDRVAEALKRSYPKQRIGIEGHTDNAPLYGGTFATTHQLAAAQSNAVLEHFTRRNQMPSSQLFTLAHGDNYPIGDNQSPASRASNRRVEFVVYPETF
jgi:flagellar motor protein MotB